MVRFLLPCVLAGLTAVTNAIPTITAKGSKFFTSEGNQFYVKGKPLFVNFCSSCSS